MSDDELLGYKVLLRIADALENIHKELGIMNSEGLVTFKGQTMDEN